MCIILDVNCISKFKNPADEDMEPVWDWLERKSGKILYSDTKQFREEWDAGGGYQLRRQLQRRDKIKLMSPQDVLKKENQLKNQIKSDPHIIALAMVAKAKVLVVQRLPNIPIGGRGRPRGADPALQADFKNQVGGSVYITKSHSHLLTRDTCP